VCAIADCVCVNILHVIDNLIIFVLTCLVFIGLFIIIISLEELRDIDRHSIRGEYSNSTPLEAQVGGGGKILVE
jgi:hypothetical protein